MKSPDITNKLMSVAEKGQHEHMDQDLASLEIAIWLVQNGIFKANRISLKLDCFWSFIQGFPDSRGKYFSKNPKLFPTPTKTLPQHNNHF